MGASMRRNQSSIPLRLAPMINDWNLSLRLISQNGTFDLNSAFS